MSFVEIFKDYSWNEVEKFIYSRTTKDVELSLSRSKKDFYDFCTLISPVANNYLEDFARLSSAITRKRFGNTMQMYIPLYLSNECSNVCTYCGFSKYNKINRKTLNHEEILKEVEIIKRQGFQHVLLVTGESRQYADVNYLESAINLIKPHFSNISIEVQPLECDEYLRLKKAGTYAVLVYQETYDRDSYKKYHLKGAEQSAPFAIRTPTLTPPMGWGIFLSRARSSSSQAVTSLAIVSRQTIDFGSISSAEKSRHTRPRVSGSTVKTQ